MFGWLKNMRRTREDHGMGALMAEMQREADMRERGWVPFVNPPSGSPSPIGKTIEIIDRDEIVFCSAYEDIHPMFNVAGKFWRVYNPQWTAEEIAGFRKEGHPPFVLNRIGNLADAHTKKKPASP